MVVAEDKIYRIISIFDKALGLDREQARKATYGTYSSSLFVHPLYNADSICHSPSSKFMRRRTRSVARTSD